MPRSKRSRRKHAKRESNNKISEEMKAGSGEGEKEGPTICLFAMHSPLEHSSLYVIRLPLDLSEVEECDQMFDVYDSKPNITTISPFMKEGTSIREGTACVNLGSKFYFFGGNNSYAESKLDLDPLSRCVQFLDINDPKPELQSAAPMHTAKNNPCVFVADGMIYAFAPHPVDCTTKLLGYNYTGLFERYEPFTDCWQVLPDPPLFHSWTGIDLLDCATIIGRLVIIGCPYFHAIFDLDSLTWDNTLPPRPPPNLGFPYGSIFLQQSASLYRLSGRGVPRTIYCQFGTREERDDPTAVRRFPLPADTLGVHHSRLLMNHSGANQIMAEAKDLDENKSFTKSNFLPHRFFFHVGDRFFCHVVTAHLYDELCQTQLELCSRAFFIKFFQEVPSHTDNSKTVFRTVASFCYKTDTTFPNFSHSARCSVIGTVPDSWINSPPNKKQESELKSVNKEMNSISNGQSSVTSIEREKSEVGQTRRHELEKTESEDTEVADLKKLLAAREEEIRLLKAELAKKNELLKVRTGVNDLSIEGNE